MARILRFSVRDAAARAALKKAVPGASDMEALYSVIGRSILTKIQLGFKTSTDPWGGAWKPLKMRQGQPLMDTRDHLYKRITYQADPQGVTIGTKFLATWKGKTSDIAKVHQFGATVVPRPDNKSGLLRFGKGGSAAGATPSSYVYSAKSVIPARPFFPIRPGSNVVSLPPVWSKAVVDALKRYWAGRTGSGLKKKAA
jgi:phage gpG-like protein